VSGYAYASSFRSRTAYSWTAEVSVYVHPEVRGRGIGRAVYGGLLRLLELQGYRSAYGIATTPNAASEALHRGLGFEPVGRFPGVGYKHGRWHDVLCWRIALGRDDAVPDRIRPVGEVLEEWQSPESGET
jgi:phosphinothricin acetyltransferase